VQLSHPTVFIRVNNGYLPVLTGGNLIKFEFNNFHGMFNGSDLRRIFNVEYPEYFVVAGVENDDNVIAKRYVLSVHGVNLHATLLRVTHELAFLGLNLNLLVEAYLTEVIGTLEQEVHGFFDFDFNVVVPVVGILNVEGAFTAGNEVILCEFE